MQSNIVDHSEETEQRIIRYAPSTHRPHSPIQPLWKGCLPAGVKKIMAREALDPPHRPHYAKWASNFALLTNEFLVGIFEPEMERIKGLVRDEWQAFPFVDCHCCKVGDDYLWVQGQKEGWTIELCHPDTDDPDARILAIENMPVLCQEGIWAARLALACYPKPPATLAWLSHW